MQVVSYLSLLEAVHDANLTLEIVPCNAPLTRRKPSGLCVWLNHQITTQGTTIAFPDPNQIFIPGECFFLLFAFSFQRFRVN